MKRLVAAAVLFQLAAVGATPRADAVTFRGLGPAKFGMTVTQFGWALKESMPEPQDREDRGCFYLETKRFPGVAFMFEDGHLRRIDVRTDKIESTDGITVGTPISDVKRRYGSRLVDEPHHYSGPEGRYLTVNLSSAIATRFETSGSKVDNFYVGYKAQIQYVEGCL